MNTYEATAEKRIIGCLLISRGDYLDDTHLRPADFTGEWERAVFELMLQMRRESKPIDEVTVATEQPAWANQLWEANALAVTAANADYYEKLIHDRNTRRSIGGVVSLLSGAILEGDPDEVLDLARGQIDELQKGRLFGEIEFAEDLVMDSVEHLNTVLDFIPSQWNLLNELLGGFRPGALYIVGARPAVGKSVVALNLAQHLAKSGAVSFHSLEMGKRELMNRLFSSLAMVSMDHIEKRQLTDSDWHKIARTQESFRLPIAIADKSGQTLTEIRAYARAVNRAKPLKAIVVDYLQLMQDTEKGRSRYESVTAISNGLKILARDLNVPVIALAQLNRAVEGRKDSEPTMADLRDSGAIEQDADVVILLNRVQAEHDGEDEKTRLVMNIAKNRHGRTGHIALYFDGMFASVREVN